MQGNLNFFCIAGDGFIDTVINHLLYQVIGSGGIRVHAGAFSNRIQSRQDFYIGRIITLAQACLPYNDFLNEIQCFRHDARIHQLVC